MERNQILISLKTVASSVPTVFSLDNYFASIAETTKKAKYS